MITDNIKAIYCMKLRNYPNTELASLRNCVGWGEVAKANWAYGRALEDGIISKDGKIIAVDELNSALSHTIAERLAGEF